MSVTPPAEPMALVSPLPGLAAWTCDLVRSARDVQAFAAMLSPAEQARAARFGNAQLRDRYIVGRGTLRTLLADRLGITQSEVAIARGRRGRPFVANPDAGGLDFNVSHTDHTALFALIDGPRIGVDIEHADRQPNVEGIVRKFMSPNEQAHLATLDADARRRALLRLWTCKEAMSKATGDALSAPFRRLDVSLDGSPRLVDGPAPYTPAQWQLATIEVPGGYFATAALWHEHASPVA